MSAGDPLAVCCSWPVFTRSWTLPKVFFSCLLIDLRGSCWVQLSQRSTSLMSTSHQQILWVSRVISIFSQCLIVNASNVRRQCKVPTHFCTLPDTAHIYKIFFSTEQLLGSACPSFLKHKLLIWSFSHTVNNGIKKIQCQIMMYCQKTDTWSERMLIRTL